jgi:D-alanyl-D-alanine dipeptidase
MRTRSHVLLWGLVIAAVPGPQTLARETSGTRPSRSAGATHSRATVTAKRLPDSDATAKAKAEAPKPGDLLEVKQHIPDVVVDLRYATPENFVGEQLYPDGARCLLRRDTLERLTAAADALREKGYRIKLWDCYRPLAVQWKMWKRFPRPGYVANPEKGSHHNRGAAVDLTLMTMEGEEVEMPTPYDSFQRAAHQGYTGGTDASRKHRGILRRAMEEAGFRINRSEWWHYSLPGAGRFPVRDEPLVEAE